jgi:hypothetical protein
MDWTSLVAPTLTAAASFLGAWLATQFALRRFYREKTWERKTAAYSVIFEALFDMARWHDQHLTAYFRQREIGEPEATDLRKEYQRGKLTLQRRLASEVWLLPDECKARVDRMLRKLDVEPNDWFEMLENNLGEIKSTTDDLTRMVRADLNL